jgi:hypothetical protein
MLALSLLSSTRFVGAMRVLSAPPVMWSLPDVYLKRSLGFRARAIDKARSLTESVLRRTRHPRVTANGTAFENRHWTFQRRKP